jgi:LDH2 family malate/lactate/ureidoglycolate dehydrogenase
LALELGAKRLAEAARAQGIAALAVVNAHHFAALWPEVESLAELGLVAFAFLSNSSFVAPHGGTKALFGTNPMAFGWPRAGKPPMIFDQSSSASARGEIMLRRRADREIPLGWAIDRDGHPTTDPAEALAGAQLTFGGHKGSAIALMIELLAGPLIGDVLSFEATEGYNDDGGPVAGGEFMIAIDPGRCLASGDRAAQLQHAERLFERLLAQGSTRLPSDRRQAARGRTQVGGAFVPRSLFDELQKLKSWVPPASTR